MNFSPMTPAEATVTEEPFGILALPSMSKATVTPPPSLRTLLTLPTGTPERRTTDSGSTPMTCLNPA